MITRLSYPSFLASLLRRAHVILKCFNVPLILAVMLTMLTCRHTEHHYTEPLQVKRESSLLFQKVSEFEKAIKWIVVVAE